MLSGLMKARCQLVRVAGRNFGSFEQHSTILPRYFLVKYQLDGKEY